MKKNLAILILLIVGLLASPIILRPGNAVAADWIDLGLEVPEVTEVREGAGEGTIDSFGPIGPGGEGDPDSLGDGNGGVEGIADWDYMSSIFGVDVLPLKALLIFCESSSWLVTP
jgi:hypothetical protein